MPKTRRLKKLLKYGILFTEILIMEWMDPLRRFAGIDAATIANNHLNDLGGNNDGKSWNFPSYLYQREIQPVEPVSLERSDFEERQERSGKQEEEDGILEYDSPSGDDDIPSLEREADNTM